MEATGGELALYLAGREQPKVKISCTVVLLSFCQECARSLRKADSQDPGFIVNCAEHNPFSPCSGVTTEALGVKGQPSSARERNKWQSLAIKKLCCPSEKWLRAFSEIVYVTILWKA